MTWYFPDLSYFEPGAKIKEILKKSNGVLAIRAGYGVGFKDPKFDTWREEAKDAKLLLIYHFVVKPGRKYGGSVEENVNYFVKLVKKRRPNEVFVIDAEPASGNWSAADINKWRRLVQEKLGGPVPLVYANESYASERRSVFTSDRGWVAKYGMAGRDASPPKVPHIIWQHAADGYGKPRGDWPGTPNDTDENRVEVSPAEFVKKILGEVKPDFWKITYKGNHYTVPWATPFLQKGSKGLRVEWVQRCLLALGYRLPRWGADSDFGDETRDALKAFQKAHTDENGEPLKVTGVYDHHTARGLYKALGGTP